MEATEDGSGMAIGLIEAVYPSLSHCMSWDPFLISAVLVCYMILV
jgi:hypothetical protein